MGTGYAETCTEEEVESDMLKSRRPVEGFKKGGRRKMALTAAFWTDRRREKAKADRRRLHKPKWEKSRVCTCPSLVAAYQSLSQMISSSLDRAFWT